MARVLFVVPRFHTNLCGAVRCLRQDGHDVGLLVNQIDAGEDHTHAVPIELGKYPTVAEVAAAVDGFRPDLMIVRNAHALSPRAAAAARRRRVPVMLYNLTPATEAPDLRRRLKLWMKGLPVRRVTPVPGDRRSATQDRNAFFLPWPVSSLPGVIVPPPGDKLRVLLIGKLWHARKNHVAFIEAVERAGLQDRIELSILGSASGSATPYTQKLLEMVAQRPWVSVRASVPYREMGTFYASHDVCVLPSFREPLGIAPLEGMPYGCIPVISSEAGAQGYVDHGVNGYICDPANLDGVMPHLADLARDPAARTAMKGRVIAQYQALLSEEAFSRRFTQLLGRLGIA